MTPLPPPNNLGPWNTCGPRNSYTYGPKPPTGQKHKLPRTNHPLNKLKIDYHIKQRKNMANWPNRVWADLTSYTYLNSRKLSRLSPKKKKTNLRILRAASFTAFVPNRATICANAVRSSGARKKGYRPDNRQRNITPHDHISTAKNNSEIN